MPGFLDLSLELRDMIYRRAVEAGQEYHLFPTKQEDEYYWVLHKRETGHIDGLKTTQPYGFGLVMACRLTYSESIHHVYTRQFTLTCSHPQLSRFISNISEASRNAITKLCLQTRDYNEIEDNTMLRAASPIVESQTSVKELTLSGHDYRHTIAVICYRVHMLQMNPAMATGAPVERMVLHVNYGLSWTREHSKATFTNRPLKPGPQGRVTILVQGCKCGWKCRVPSTFKHPDFLSESDEFSWSRFMRTWNNYTPWTYAHGSYRPLRPPQQCNPSAEEYRTVVGLSFTARNERVNERGTAKDHYQAEVWFTDLAAQDSRVPAWVTEPFK